MAHKVRKIPLSSFLIAILILLSGFFVFTTLQSAHSKTVTYRNQVAALEINAARLRNQLIAQGGLKAVANDPTVSQVLSGNLVPTPVALPLQSFTIDASPGKPATRLTCKSPKEDGNYVCSRG